MICEPFQMLDGMNEIGVIVFLHIFCCSSFFTISLSVYSSSFYIFDFLDFASAKNWSEEKIDITLTAKQRRLVIKCFNVVYLIYFSFGIGTKCFPYPSSHRSPNYLYSPPRSLSGFQNIASLCCYYLHNHHIMLASVEKCEFRLSHVLHICAVSSKLINMLAAKSTSL